MLEDTDLALIGITDPTLRSAIVTDVRNLFATVRGSLVCSVLALGLFFFSLHGQKYTFYVHVCNVHRFIPFYFILPLVVGIPTVKR